MAVNAALFMNKVAAKAGGGNSLGSSQYNEKTGSKRHVDRSSRERLDPSGKRVVDGPISIHMADKRSSSKIAVEGRNDTKVPLTKTRNYDLEEGAGRADAKPAGLGDQSAFLLTSWKTFVIEPPREITTNIPVDIAAITPPATEIVDSKL